MVGKRQPLRRAVAALAALAAGLLGAWPIGGVGALKGPGGLECKTAKECNLLAARERAIQLAARQAAKAEASKLEADAVRAAGGRPLADGSDDGEAGSSTSTSTRSTRSGGGGSDDDPPAARAKSNAKTTAAAARAQQQRGGAQRSGGGGPQRTARFACAVVLVSGPAGLRFASDEHVDRFKRNAKGAAQTRETNEAS
jgi:hypothetical protein